MSVHSQEETFEAASVPPMGQLLERSPTILIDSRLGRDEIGIVFGAGAREVVVDGEPWYLAFDTKMLGWRCILRVIEGADLNPNKRTIGVEIPAHHV